MVYTGVKKLTAFIILLFLLSLESFAQRYLNDIRPLESERKDVVRVLGNGITNGTADINYRRVNEDIIITFYKSSCSVSDEREFKLTTDTVTSVKILPKNNPHLFDLIKDSRPYLKYNLPDEKILYVNSSDGIFIVAKISKQLETIEKIHIFPTNLKLPECFFKSFDNDSKQLVSNYSNLKSTKGEQLIFWPIQIGNYFEEDSKSSKNNVLTEFSKKLKNYENGFGYIFISRAKNETNFVFLQRRKKLLDNLNRRGISCKKLIIIDVGSRGLAGVSLTIVHKTFISEHNLKPLCN